MRPLLGENVLDAEMSSELDSEPYVDISDFTRSVIAQHLGAFADTVDSSPAISPSHSGSKHNDDDNDCSCTASGTGTTA
jgi:hypothetical protein